MHKTNQFYLFILIPAIMIACNRQSLSAGINDFQRFPIAEHWAIKFPSIPIELDTSTHLYEKMYRFQDDTLLLKVESSSIDPGEAQFGYDYCLKAERDNLDVGSCLGGFEGTAEFFNFIDTDRHLSGQLVTWN